MNKNLTYLLNMHLFHFPSFSFKVEAEKKDHKPNQLNQSSYSVSWKPHYNLLHQCKKSFGIKKIVNKGAFPQELNPPWIPFYEFSDVYEVSSYGSTWVLWHKAKFKTQKSNLLLWYEFKSRNIASLCEPIPQETLIISLMNTLHYFFSPILLTKIKLHY